MSFDFATRIFNPGQKTSGHLSNFGRKVENLPYIPPSLYEQRVLFFRCLFRAPFPLGNVETCEWSMNGSWFPRPWKINIVITGEGGEGGGGEAGIVPTVLTRIVVWKIYGYFAPLYSNTFHPPDELKFSLDSASVEVSTSALNAKSSFVYAHVPNMWKNGILWQRFSQKIEQCFSFSYHMENETYSYLTINNKLM